MSLMPAIAGLRTFVAMLGRRRLLGCGLSLGALTMLTGLIGLTGCAIGDGDAAQRALAAVSVWNDELQSALFGPHRLAKEFAPGALAEADRFNAYEGKDEVPKLTADSYRLSLAVAIGDKRPRRVPDFELPPQVSQITRPICVGGWSHVGYERAGGGMDMQAASRPQTLIALTRRSDTLQPEFGYPFEVRIPTQFGLKHPKFVTTLFVTGRRPDGFREDRGYNGFSGI